MSERAPLIGLDPTSGPMPVSEKRPGDAAGVARRRGHRSRVERPRRERRAHAGHLPRARARAADVRAAVFVRKPSVSVPPEPMDWERLISQVTVAVAGFGG